MVDQCIEEGFFALWQSADNPFWLNDNSVNAVLMAYGTHHIPKQQRPRAVSEAFRILKPGGVLVLHDFDEASPTARWFENVVSMYSSTSHDYPHFTEFEMKNLHENAGFQQISVTEIDDPFIFRAKDKDIALNLLANYYRETINQ